MRKIISSDTIWRSTIQENLFRIGTARKGIKSAEKILGLIIIFILDKSILETILDNLVVGVVKIGFIYKITNKTNNKSYIGKTLQTPEKRFKQHIADSKRERCKNRPLYRAMNKYGIENFMLEIIEECSNNVISDREVYWIDYYDTYKNGYNATKGGDGSAYINEQEVIKYYDNYKICSKVAEILHINVGTVTRILRNNNINILSSQEILIKRANNVLMLDKNNNVINEFESVYRAAQYLIDNNLSNTKLSSLRFHIVETCRGKRKTVAGFIWKYKK